MLLLSYIMKSFCLFVNSNFDFIVLLLKKLIITLLYFLSYWLKGRSSMPLAVKHFLFLQIFCEQHISKQFILHKKGES